MVKKEAHHVSDEEWMSLAVVEAKRGIGWTIPNPVVGAVIVRNGRLIGRGFHRQAGRAHAESRHCSR